MEHKDIIDGLLESLRTAEAHAKKLIVSGFSDGPDYRLKSYIDLWQQTYEARRGAEDMHIAEVVAKRPN